MHYSEINNAMKRHIYSCDMRVCAGHISGLSHRAERSEVYIITHDIHVHVYTHTKRFFPKWKVIPIVL